MEQDGIRDDISKGFADLTVLLENTAALVTEGQSQRCTIEELEHLAALIWPEVNRITKTLAATERLIEIYPND